MQHQLRRLSFIAEIGTSLPQWRWNPDSHKTRLCRKQARGHTPKWSVEHSNQNRWAACSLALPSDTKKGRFGLQKPNGHSRVPDLTELTWQSLLSVEASRDFEPSDPVFIKFRSDVLRAIADLEILKSREDGDIAKGAKAERGQTRFGALY